MFQVDPHVHYREKSENGDDDQECDGYLGIVGKNLLVGVAELRLLGQECLHGSLGAVEILDHGLELQFQRHQQIFKVQIFYYVRTQFGTKHLEVFGEELVIGVFETGKTSCLELQLDVTALRMKRPRLVGEDIVETNVNSRLSLVTMEHFLRMLRVGVAQVREFVDETTSFSTTQVGVEVGEDYVHLVVNILNESKLVVLRIKDMQIELLRRHPVVSLNMNSNYVVLDGVVRNTVRQLQLTGVLFRISCSNGLYCHAECRHKKHV